LKVRPPPPLTREAECHGVCSGASGSHVRPPTPPSRRRFDPTLILVTRGVGFLKEATAAASLELWGLILGQLRVPNRREASVRGRCFAMPITEPLAGSGQLAVPFSRLDYQSNCGVGPGRRTNLLPPPKTPSLRDPEAVENVRSRFLTIWPSAADTLRNCLRFFLFHHNIPEGTRLPGACCRWFWFRVATTWRLTPTILQLRLGGVPAVVQRPHQQQLCLPSNSVAWRVIHSIEGCVPNARTRLISSYTHNAMWLTPVEELSLEEAFLQSVFSTVRHFDHTLPPLLAAEPRAPVGSSARRHVAILCQVFRVPVEPTPQNFPPPGEGILCSPAQSAPNFDEGSPPCVLKRPPHPADCPLTSLSHGFPPTPPHAVPGPALRAFRIRRSRLTLTSLTLLANSGAGRIRSTIIRFFVCHRSWRFIPRL